MRQTLREFDDCRPTAYRVRAKGEMHERQGMPERARFPSQCPSRGNWYTERGNEERKQGCTEKARDQPPSLAQCETQHNPSRKASPGSLYQGHFPLAQCPFSCRADQSSPRDLKLACPWRPITR